MNHTKAIEDFEAIQDELFLVGVDTVLAREAGDLAEGLGLRGYDAVHLASALALGEPDHRCRLGRRASARCGRPRLRDRTGDLSGPWANGVPMNHRSGDPRRLDATAKRA